MRVAGLERPERPQAERVGREHALVPVPRDQRHRALGERAERLAQVHVEAAQLLRHALDVVDDRRQHELHRLQQRQAVAVDQRLHRAFRSCESEPSSCERHAQHARLLAQARDRVDLAVVAEHANGCTRLKDGQVFVE